ncbi:hypothetical protein, partial [Pseudomonas sp.]|uniref:hypothetical protein n=1 Tax=Pseudomonas sp. TaxID=306 RepID=UPI002610733B
ASTLLSPGSRSKLSADAIEQRISAQDFLQFPAFFTTSQDAWTPFNDDIYIRYKSILWRWTLPCHKP